MSESAGSAAPRHAALLITGVLAAWFGYDLLRMPVQISDSLSLLVDVQDSPSVMHTFITEATRGAYLRPLFHVQIHGLYAAAGGHYSIVFRTFHVLLLAAALFLFTRAMRVSSWKDFAAAAFALIVLTGLHTFRGLVREAYAINHFLEVIVFCLLALNLSQSRGGWWIDGLAVVVFVAASLTLESGLLVWVVLVAAWLTGLRGVSARAVTVVTGLLAVYVAVRFAYLDVGIEARPSGFMFEMLEFRDIRDRFGPTPVFFYAYNVITSALSVLFSDPDGGVFEIGRAWRQGDVPPRLYLAVASSALTTGLIAWAVNRRLRFGGPGAWTGTDGLFLLSGAVLVANAAMSYAYTKHEIISPAGAFYGLAAFAAARHAIGQLERSRGTAAAVVCVLLAATSSLWMFRSAGVHHMMQAQAFKERNDWARIRYDRLADVAGMDAPPHAGTYALVDRLRGDALALRIANPHTLPRWADRWWGE
jgi:hypothetical protein